MSIEFRKNDITTITSGIVIHGVNCQRAMGSGVALAIMKKWPIIYDAYMMSGRGKHMLGTVGLVPINDGLFVGNCYTQEFSGSDGAVYASASAIKQCLQLVGEFAESQYEKNGPVLTIHTPYIGCGLGGLEQSVFETLIQDMDAGYMLDIVVNYI